MNQFDTSSFTVYTKSNCRFCVMAKNLLQSKQLPYSEIHVDETNAERIRNEFGSMIRTVPIVLDAKGSLIGGYTHLAQLLEQ